ncbi:hypothetical protein [Salinigranum marinum]|nr:hypothetical protein [Salinigranum marinum]
MTGQPTGGDDGSVGETTPSVAAVPSPRGDGVRALVIRRIERAIVTPATA